MLSIGRTLLYKLVKRGELTPAKVGTKTLFYASDLAALLTRLQGKSKSERANWLEAWWETRQASETVSPAA